MGVPKTTAGTVIAGRYRLVAPLSRGGMGSVWRAEHLSLGSPIAIKLIDASLVEHDEPRARFEQEARAAAALRSPHVVQILDHGVDRGLPFIAMELLDGESLGARLHRLGTLPPAQLARIFQDVARAMKKAHELGIVHRDLKPDNIFLVRNDDQEIAKVLDFGIAKAREPFGEWKGGGTRTGALIGTPGYMSPEQAQGMVVDHATDLWALGVIAFECVCGRLPFPSEKPGELILQICAKPLPIPSTIARVPPRFDAWFARACDREPRARFASAKELADALTEALGLAGSPADRSGGFAPIAGPPVQGLGPVQAVSPAVPAAPSPPQRPAPIVAVVQAPPLAAPVFSGGQLVPGAAVSPGGQFGPGAAVSPGGQLVPGAPVSPGGQFGPGAAVSPGGQLVPGAAVSPGGQWPAAGGAQPGPMAPPRTPSGTELRPGLSPAAGFSPAGAGPQSPAPIPGQEGRPPAGVAAATLLAGPSLDERGGTMSGGAVMDSDPSTILRLPGSRSKRGLLIGVAAFLAVAAGAVVWIAAGGPAQPSAGADSSFPMSPTAPLTGPLPTVAPAEPAQAQPTSEPIASAKSAVSVTPAMSAPPPGTTASSKPSATASARPSGAPRATAQPATTATNTRIGF